MTTVTIYGGMPYPKQKRELSRPYEILVATPGRLIDHLNSGRICLRDIELLILDEADRMLDMGFLEPVEEIAAATSESRQTLLFSATLKGPVLKLARGLLSNPFEISIERDKAEHENIEQRLHFVDNMSHKHRLLDHLLQDDEVKHAIVFTATKRMADELNEQLEEQGYSVDALHGDMSQKHRNRTIKQFRIGRTRFLVATDVAARGIDVDSVTHVINFDLPNNAEDYVHRIGRTGRAGAAGIAVSFASKKDWSIVQEIRKFTGRTLEPTIIAGFEPRDSFGPGHSAKGRGNGRRPNGPGRFGRSSQQSGRGGDSSRGQRSFSRSSNSDRDSRQDNNSFDRPKRPRPSDGESRGRPSDGESRGRPRFSDSDGQSRGRPSDGESRGRPRFSDSDGDSRGKPRFSDSDGRRSDRPARSESKISSPAKRARGNGRTLEKAKVRQGF